jgi:hypothetical protein
MMSSFVRTALVAVFVFTGLVANPAVAEDLPSNLSPRHAAAVDTARRHIGQHLDAMGMVNSDVDDLVVSDVYASRHNRVVHVYFQQRFRGIEVYNALINVNILPNGEVFHSGSRAEGRLEDRRLATIPGIEALAAVNRAALAAGLTATDPIMQIERSTAPDRHTIFSKAGIALEPIEARLVYFDDGKTGLRLAWQVDLYERSAQHYWVSFVDAESGDLIERRDFVVHDRWEGTHDHSGGKAAAGDTGSAPARAGDPAPLPLSAADGSQYRVFEMPKGHPDDGARTLVGEPAHEPASPYGWHDTNGVDGPEYTITRGNNAHAYQDRGNNDGSVGDEPDGGTSLTFDFPLDLGQEPDQYIDAAVTNLFYWNNLHHDLIYVRGFDEAAGNFQVTNYSGDGVGGDAVRAEAQDGSGTNNANFYTPPDGSAPRMQMYTWDTTTPGRDGDLDSGIVLHEYGHGISIRQTGGPSTSSCLSGSEQAGEGWSDWQTLVYTAQAAHGRTTNRGVGTYALGQPVDGPGIRAYPYNTDMGVDPRTYADTQSATPPHGVGSIWTAILWEVYWNLVDEHGFNPDFYADWDQGGNLLAMQLVNDGLKLQPCNPGFVDARDAILAADQALTGGANQCLIWEGFAKRGLGFSASQGSSGSNADNVEAFDLPAECEFGTATPSEAMACAGDPVDFAIELGSAWTAPVTLSASGHPGTAAFSQNPVSAPGDSVLTIDGTSGEATGVYNITVDATDGSENEQFPLVLELFEQSPGGAVPDAPADGAGNVPFQPTFSWAAAPGAAGYLVEVATDAGFVNTVYSETVDGTVHQASSALAADTTHYWRVQALNPCGSAAASSTYSFTTASSSLVCGGSVDFESGIPGDWTVTDDSPSGDGIVWVTSEDVECDTGNNTSGSGTAACADSDYAGSGSPAYDTSLVTPPIDLSGVTSAELTASVFFRYYGVSQMSIEIWNGSGWDVAWSVDADATADVNLDLDAYTGSDAVQVRFRYSGDGWDWYSQVDDVAINCTGVISHTVSASVGSGQGSISPSGAQAVDHGNSLQFTLEADPGHAVDSVGGTCGGSLSGQIFTTDPVEGDCSVEAFFDVIVDELFEDQFEPQQP